MYAKFFNHTQRQIKMSPSKRMKIMCLEGRGEVKICFLAGIVLEMPYFDYFFAVLFGNAYRGVVSLRPILFYL
jgi:hypothetical protein